MTFLVNQTKSYTLVVSTETGEMRLELADELKENLKEMLAGAETSTDAAEAFFEALGADAWAFVEAMDAIYGMGGELAAGFAEGGVEAMEVMLAEIMANSPGADLMDRLNEKGEFGGFGGGFVEMPGSDVADILGFGAWDAASGTDTSIFSPTYGVTEGNREADFFETFVFDILTAGGWGVVPIINAAEDHVEERVVEKIDYANEKIDEFTDEASDFVDSNPNNVIDTEVTFIPADPDEGYINPLDNPFGPEWTKDEALDPTYGQTLTDSDQEGGEGGKDYDPEAELQQEILTDPEQAAKAYTAGEVQDAAEFGIVSTTLPVEPEPEFEFNFGDKPDLGGGEDFTGAMDGEQVFEAELQVEFAAEGVVDTEGTSTSVVDHKSDDFHSHVDTFDFV